MLKNLKQILPRLPFSSVGQGCAQDDGFFSEFKQRILTEPQQGSCLFLSNKMKNVIASAKKQAVSLPIPADEEPLDFARMFGRKAAVEVEFGCGKGKFLLDLAAREPEADFLGIDWAGKWLNFGRQKIDRRGLANIKFIKTKVESIVPRIPEASVRMFHIYFPDPWPKRRHQKRRFVSSGLLKQLYERLLPDGKIEMATDFEHYFKAFCEASRECGIVWQSVRESLNERPAYPDLKTNYEIKYEKENRTLYYLELKK